MQSDFPTFLRRQFPHFSEPLLNLFTRVTENTNLLRSDFYSLHDLLDLTDNLQEETLAVALLLLFVAMDEGSPCIELSEASLSRRFKDVIGDDEPVDLVQKTLRDLTENRYDRLIGQSVDENKPVVLHRRGDRRFLYIQKYLHHEIAFWDHLRSRLSFALQDNPSELQNIVHEVLHERPMRFGTKPLKLDHHQRLALGVALLQPFSVISGGPGTGKTSIAVTLLRCLIRTGITPDRIALAAPTGRAAQRLTDSLHDGLQRLPNYRDDTADALLEELDAVTLHKLLAYHPGRGMFQRHEENPIPADVVIVDEVSMVGLVMMSQLLQALRPDCKLILLGDKDQLPSVEAGAVLAHLLQQTEDKSVGFSPDFCGRMQRLFPVMQFEPGLALHALQDHLVVLQSNYRSQKEIRIAAEAVNLRRTDILDRLPAKRPDQSFSELSDGCWFFEQSPNTQQLRAVLDHWGSEHFLLKANKGLSFLDLIEKCRLPVDDKDLNAGVTAQLDELFKQLNRGRLLTLIRETPWGCVDINRYMEYRLRRHFGAAGSTGVFPGVPILVTQNDPRRELFNGDVGLTLMDKNGHLQVVFARRGRYVSYPIHSLPAHELGFALTVHKSQGSEYDQVLLVVPPASGRRLLCKELIYTAITRAKKRAILYGTKEALQTAIARRIVRESGVVAV